MPITRLYIPIRRDELDQLVELARAEHRHPSAQAAVMIGQALSEEIQKRKAGEVDEA